ncbi:hypothetical protein T484DRAFT_1906974 [Baffinella frigidus]|nr:hypothetical protein T484DRAFT_1906974 [Cryptophyta sp. CCMP2293]
MSGQATMPASSGGTPGALVEVRFADQQWYRGRLLDRVEGTVLWRVQFEVGSSIQNVTLNNADVRFVFSGPAPPAPPAPQTASTPMPMLSLGLQQHESPGAGEKRGRDDLGLGALAAMGDLGGMGALGGHMGMDGGMLSGMIGVEPVAMGVGAEPQPKKPRGGAGETGGAGEGAGEGGAAVGAGEGGAAVVLKNVRWCGTCGKQFPNPSALAAHM